ncbi:hypothetical protein SAY86_018505 [Trapa natans]|uniref:AB hydrolase-1 domain-containing protein n=1 Tax=Trapa natans TaxID=22666 RepID=A0AAN7LCV4_TRANT|nr:hypothetical protein SAY86_018505 [Trapa natans]
MKKAEAERAGSVMPQRPAHFVFVHGFGLGAWCWYKVRTLLESSGYTVSCIDLKSAGTDGTDANSIVSFHDYNMPLTDFMLSLPENERVILVGHSAGGLSLTQAMRGFAGKIRVAVFVAATMLRLGFYTDQDVKDGVLDLSVYGDVHVLGFRKGYDKYPTSILIKKEFQRSIMYQMSPQEDSTLASMLMKPGPMLALQNARFNDYFARDMDMVPRVYIKSVHDNVLKREQQESMIRRWPPAETYTIESDHCPFFSAPLVLCGLLVMISSSY